MALSVGGAGRHIIEMINHWDRCCKIDILIPKLGYDIAKKFTPNISYNKIMVYQTPLEKVKIANNWLLHYFMQLSRVIKTILLVLKLENNYDIVVSSTPLPYDSIPAVFLKIRKKVKIITYFHEVLPTLKGKNLIHRFMTIIVNRISFFLGKNYSNLIFVVNDSVRNYFIKKGFNPKKVILTSNGIHYKKILNTPPVKKEYEGIFVGQLMQRKGIYDLIKAWKIVVMTYPLAKLLIIGDGIERKKLEEKIKEEELDENITLAVKVLDEKKFMLMKKSKVFVFPSYKEGWGIVIAEAMACSLPVVTYDLPVYKEVFGEYIFTVKVGNYKEMVNKFIDIIENYPDYNETVVKARNFISRYSWDRVAEHQLSHIEKIFMKN